MTSPQPTRRTKLISRVVDQVRFVGALAKSPKTVGAIAPTSEKLARLMAGHINLHSGLPVLELGPGTGAITDVLVKYGVPQKDLYAVEFAPKFCRQLRTRFRHANIVEGNAFDLQSALSEFPGIKFDCVISGLPLLNFPADERQQFLQGALDFMEPGRPLVQFSYGVHPPVKQEDTTIQVDRSRWIARNIPPARVWTYRRAIKG